MSRIIRFLSINSLIMVAVVAYLGFSTLQSTADDPVDPNLVKKHSHSARQWLRTARVRASSRSVEDELDFFLNYVKKSARPIEIYGTNHDELNDLRLKGYFNEAKHWLTTAKKRSAKHSVEDELEFFKKNVERSQKAVSVYGESDKSLSTLLKTSYTNEASTWLNAARERSQKHQVDDETEFFLKYAKKSGRDLNQFGSSLAEIERLKKSGYKHEAAQWLKYARDRAKTRNVDDEIDLFEKYMNRAGLSYEYFQVNKEAVNALRSQHKKANTEREPASE